MDGIITIAVIAVAIIFKVVEKRLKGAAGDEVFPTIPLDPDMVTEPEQEDFDAQTFEEAPRMLVGEPEPQVRRAPAKPAPKKMEEPILVEDKPEAKEKIDPRKLVLYSEIMKPKHLE